MKKTPVKIEAVLLVEAAPRPCGEVVSGGVAAGWEWVMAVDIDTTKALRGVADLRRLVAAVIGADEHDEPDWLEWKSTFDLGDQGGLLPRRQGDFGDGQPDPGPGWADL